VRSVELLRWEGGRMLSGHGVHGRTHGLTVVTSTNNGGGSPALGRSSLCYRACRRSVPSFRNAGASRALARAWLDLRSSCSTWSVHGDWRCGTGTASGNTVLCCVVMGKVLYVVEAGGGGKKGNGALEPCSAESACAIDLLMQIINS
jgi:hypothetical protein